MSFWWRRCTEQSRSPRHQRLPCSSRKHLELDVTGPLDELLHIQVAVAEGRCRFRAGGVEQVRQSSADGRCACHVRRRPPPP